MFSKTRHCPAVSPKDKFTRLRLHVCTFRQLYQLGGVPAKIQWKFSFAAKSFFYFYNRRNCVKSHSNVPIVFSHKFKPFCCHARLSFLCRFRQIKLCKTSRRFFHFLLFLRRAHVAASISGRSTVFQKRKSRDCIVRKRFNLGNLKLWKVRAVMSGDERFFAQKIYENRSWEFRWTVAQVFSPQPPWRDCEWRKFITNVVGGNFNFQISFLTWSLIWQIRN